MTHHRNQKSSSGRLHSFNESTNIAYLANRRQSTGCTEGEYEDPSKVVRSCQKMFELKDSSSSTHDCSVAQPEDYSGYVNLSEAGKSKSKL